METRANHVLIGLFTIIVAVLAVLFSLWASNYTTDRNWDTYDVYFKESVTGLGVGGIVQYNGINVGEVRKLTLDPKDPRRVIARIRLQADTPVKVDTKAKLALVGLTGLAQINLSGGLPESPRLLPTAERKVPIIATAPSALQNLAETANDIVERLQMILSDENISRISGTLDDIHQITGSVAGQKQDLAALIKNLRVVSEQMNTTLVKAQSSLDSIDHNVVQNLPELMKKLDATLAQLESAGSNANVILTDNREAIANFSQNGLGQIGPALVDMRALLRELRRVASRLDRNPGGYVTGRTRAVEFETSGTSTKEPEQK